MNARSALMTRLGFPAVLGAVLALALALISGLGVTGGTSNLGGGFEMMRSHVSPQLLKAQAATFPQAPDQVKAKTFISVQPFVFPLQSSVP